MDVPELGFAVVTGTGTPGRHRVHPGAAGAVRGELRARFLARKQRGQAPKVMPLEALWWVDDPGQQDILAAVALGWATMADIDRDQWRWQAMIMQPDPIDADLVAAALAQARAKKPAPGWNGSLHFYAVTTSRYFDEGNGNSALSEPGRQWRPGTGSAAGF